MISDDILCQNFKAYMLLERGYSENKIGRAHV